MEYFSEMANSQTNADRSRPLTSEHETRTRSNEAEQPQRHRRLAADRLAGRHRQIAAYAHEAKENKSSTEKKYISHGSHPCGEAGKLSAISFQLSAISFHTQQSAIANECLEADG